MPGRKGLVRERGWGTGSHMGVKKEEVGARSVQVQEATAGIGLFQEPQTRTAGQDFFETFLRRFLP
jgi:hypothetical protein